eukprot:157950_1
MSSNSYLWRYVSVAADYVGLSNYNKLKSKKKHSISRNVNNNHSNNTHTNHNNNNNCNKKDDLYSNCLGADCLNFLVNLLDSSRPRLDQYELIDEKTLNVMKKNYILLIEIFTFLPFDNIISIIEQIKGNNYEYKQLKLATDYLIFNSTSRSYIRNLSINGYTFLNRNIIWKYLIFSDFEMTKYSELYNKYISHVQFFQHSMIEKDIDRTLIINHDWILTEYNYYDASYKSYHNVLNKEYKYKLKCILSIYCMLDPEIGYVQGMNYIAANILIGMNGDEILSFAVFSHFMKRDLSPIYFINFDYKKHYLINNKNVSNYKYQSHAFCGGGKISKTGSIGYGLRDLYLPSLPGLIVSLLQFDKLIKLYLPILYQHFIFEGIYVQNYASEWFLSLFCYILPLKLSLRLIDIFIIDGWKILHRVGLALLYYAKKQILFNKLKQEKILLLLKRKDLIKYLNINENIFINKCVGTDNPLFDRKFVISYHINSEMDIKCIQFFGMHSFILLPFHLIKLWPYYFNDNYNTINKNVLIADIYKKWCLPMHTQHIMQWIE